MNMLDVEAVFALVAFIGFTVSAAAYWVLAPWYSSRIGRNFMFLLVAIAGALGLAVFSAAVPAEARQTVGACVFGLFAISGVSFAYAIVSEQLRNRRRADNKD